DDPHPKGLDGVYVYATRGAESIDALGGARHTYPSTTGVTAIGGGCGTTLRWDALHGRATTWTLCRTVGGLALPEPGEGHRLFGRTDHTAYTCTGSALVGAVGPFRCRSQDGVEVGTVRLVERAGGVRHVRTVGRISGGDRGTETVDWWFAGDPLPRRI